MPARFVLVTGPADPDPASGASRSTTWRLVGGSGRELGRSPAGFPSVEAAADASVLVQAAAPVLAARTVRDGHRGEWRWTLDLDGDPVASAPRWFRTGDECERSVGLFLVALPWAVLTPYGACSEAS